MSAAVGEKPCTVTERKEKKMDKEVMLVGFDISNFVKSLCSQFLGDNPEMTDGEKKAYKLGINNALSLLDQTLNEFIVDEDEVYHNIAVHVPELGVMTEYCSIDELISDMEQKEK